MIREEQAYISVIQWPTGLDEAGARSILTSILGVDAYHARLRARQRLPGIVARIPAAHADTIIAALARRGVRAFAAAESSFAAMGPMIRAKRVMPTDDPSTFTFETWNGQRSEFDIRDLFLMVRGSPSTVVRRTTRDQGNESSVLVGYMTMGLAGAMMASMNNRIPRTEQRSTLTEILDLHFFTGAWLRLDGHKFCFDILGQARGLSDRANMDALTALLGTAAPHVLIDHGFASFRSPPEFIRTQVRGFSGEGGSFTSGLPAFDFYSGWACILYQTTSPAWKLGGPDAEEP